MGLYNIIRTRVISACAVASYGSENKNKFSHESKKNCACTKRSYSERLKCNGSNDGRGNSQIKIKSSRFLLRLVWYGCREISSATSIQQGKRKSIS